MQTILFIFTALSNLANLGLTENNPINDFISKQTNQNTWFAYKIKAQPNTISMCCWKNIDPDNINKNSDAVCNLNSKIHSYGSRDGSAITKNINIYVNINQGLVKNLLSVGDYCEVNENGLDITWLNTVSQSSSINWLKQLAVDSNKNTGSDALYALSGHEDKEASGALYDIAVANNHEYSENAVFWLGNTRIDGLTYLQKLYKTLPQGDVKRHINFALSQVKSSQGINLLKKIAKNDLDHEQRADALFWLGQENIEGIIQILLEAINHDPSESVRESALFSLSQIETQAATDTLLEIATNHENSELKDKALFWLAQTNPKKATQLALNILSNTQSEHQINNAVFTLSQISEDNHNDNILLQLLSGNYSNQVKKQALFWLSQSENSATMQKLQNLLEL